MVSDSSRSLEPVNRSLDYEAKIQLSGRCLQALREGSQECWEGNLGSQHAKQGPATPPPTSLTSHLPFFYPDVVTTAITTTQLDDQGTIKREWHLLLSLRMSLWAIWRQEGLIRVSEGVSVLRNVGPKHAAHESKSTCRGTTAVKHSCLIRPPCPTFLTETEGRHCPLTKQSIKVTGDK